MPFGFSSTARQTYVNSFPSPEKFRFCTDKTVSMEWLNLVPRRRTGDCFDIHSPPSLKTLWSAVMKSPKFSAWGAASPVRLLQGALVIMVLLQISQFMSFGKWGMNTMPPRYHFLKEVPNLNPEKSLRVCPLVLTPLRLLDFLWLNPSKHSVKSRNRLPDAGMMSLF